MPLNAKDREQQVQQTIDSAERLPHPGPAWLFGHYRRRGGQVQYIAALKRIGIRI